MKSLRFDRGDKRGFTTQSVQKRPERTKEPWLRPVLQASVLLAIIVFGGYWLFSFLSFREYQGIVIGDVTTIRASESAVVKSFHVDLHQNFLAGVPILQMESEELILRRSALEAEIESLKTLSISSEAEELDELRAKWLGAKSALASAQASHESAQARENLAKDFFERSVKLREEGALTQASLDSRWREAQNASLDRSAADQKLLESKQLYENLSSSLERSLQLGSKQKQENLSLIDQKEAQLQELKLREENLKIDAIRPGTVTHYHRLPGDFVQAGDPLVQVIYEGNLWIDCYVDPADRLRMEPGTPVTIKANSPVKIPISGSVISIAPVTHAIPETHRDMHERLEQFVVARVSIDAKEAAKAGISPGQLVKLRAARW